MHGISRLSEHSQKAVLKSEAGENLKVAHDWQNPSNPDAQFLRNDDDVILGYLPNYLVVEVFRLLRTCDPDLLSFKVEKVNKNAPAGFSLLCRLSACWSDGSLPFSDEQFLPIPQNAAKSCK